MNPAKKMDAKLKQEVLLQEIAKREAAFQQELTRAITNDDKANLYYELGEFYLQKTPPGYQKKALECFAQVTKLDPSPKLLVKALFQNAKLLEELGNIEESLNHYKVMSDCLEAEADDDEKGIKLREYGQALYSNELYEQALPILKAAKVCFFKSPEPKHLHRIAALLVATIQKIDQKGNKEKMNLLECMEKAGMSLEETHAFLKARGESIWLEVALIGSVKLMESVAALEKKLGFDPLVTDADGNTALHIAAKQGHVDLLGILGFYHNRETTNKKGLSPIMVAAREGRVAMVQALLRKGVTLTNDTENVLTVAIMSGQGAMLEFLLSDQQSRKLLLEKIEIGTLFRKAIAIKSKAMLALLLRFFPEEINKKYQGQTPLHYAVAEQFDAGVRFLVEAGSNIELETDKGETTLALAKVKAPKLENFLKNYATEAATEAKIKRDEMISRRQEFINLVVQIIQKKPEFVELWIADKQKRDNESLFRTELKELLEGQNYQTLFFNQNLDREGLANLLVDHLVKYKKKIVNPAGLLAHASFIKGKPFKRMDQFLKRTPQDPKKPDEPDCWEVQLSKQEAKLRLEQRKQVPLEIKSGSEVGIDNLVLTPKMREFCARFETLFDNSYCFFQAVHSGDAYSAEAVDEQQRLNLVKDGVKAVVPNLNTPSVGFIPSIPIPTSALMAGALDIFMYFRNRYRKKEADRMIHLFSAVLPSERTHFVRYTAEQLAYKYQKQIEHLTSGSTGIERFADCAVARIVDYVCSDDNHQIAYKPNIFSSMVHTMKSWLTDREIPPELQRQKDLYSTFIGGVSRVTSKFSQEMQRLSTINSKTLEDDWNAKGIFENTGVETKTGERYAHPNVKLALYGYTFGTKEEADKRGLTLGPSKGALWSPGRNWEKEGLANALGPVPESHRPVVYTPSGGPRAQVAGTGVPSDVPQEFTDRKDAKKP